MAIYHLHTEIVKRSQGHSATATAAYQAHDRIVDQRTGEIHDYSRRKGQVEKGIMAPANVPAWVHDRAKLWNAVEQAEKRRDAQLARKFDMALPKELTHHQQLELVWTFAQKELVSRGMVADYALHEPHRAKIKSKDGQEIETSNDNHHVHFAVTMRSIGPDGFGDKNRDWNKKETLEQLREAWATHSNAALQSAGRPERIDHRTLAAQHEAAEMESLVGGSDYHEWLGKSADLDRPPQRHMGKDATALERKGQTTAVGDYNRQIAADHLDRQIQRVEKQIKAEEMKLREEEAKLDVVVTVEPPKSAPPEPVKIETEKKQEVKPSPERARSEDLQPSLERVTTPISSEPVFTPKPFVPEAQSEALPPVIKTNPPIQQPAVDVKPVDWYLKCLELIRELIYQWRTAVRFEKESEERDLEAKIKVALKQSGHRNIHFEEDGPIFLDDTKPIVDLIGQEKKRLGLDKPAQSKGLSR